MQLSHRRHQSHELQPTSEHRNEMSTIVEYTYISPEDGELNGFREL